MDSFVVAALCAHFSTAASIASYADGVPQSMRRHKL
jgi:hypothetical protein